MITVVRKVPVDPIQHREADEIFPLNFWHSDRVPLLAGTLIKCWIENLPTHLQMRFRLIGKRAGHLQWDFITVEEFNNLKFLQMDAAEFELLILEIKSPSKISEISGVFLWQIWAIGNRM
jgi:hypothetical protein